LFQLSSISFCCNMSDHQSLKHNIDSDSDDWSYMAKRGKPNNSTASMGTSTGLVLRPRCPTPEADSKEEEPLPRSSGSLGHTQELCLSTPAPASYATASSSRNISASSVSPGPDGTGEYQPAEQSPTPSESSSQYRKVRAFFSKTLFSS
jgi:hypothetical protein